jgi:HSP20 family molecular chaperone IbpA
MNENTILNAQQPTEEVTKPTEFLPRIDVCETETELLLFADIPGVRPEDVNLSFENGELVLHGKVRPRNGERNVFRQEFETGDYRRTFRIHESIDAGRISAECKLGVLKVHLPKAPAFQPRQIKVQG